ncbi:SMI1/KNR4 family protein [Streptomyces indicus]|uniref:SMI1/KNR4 family protein n=1 Tax=Streptomyces indicus TaxID=417292 RepID=UPI001FE8F9D4|nr:SMI1/KNR4 family protein [Streptomyces indicus]
MRLLWEANEEQLARPGGQVTGQVGTWGYSVPLGGAGSDLMRDLGRMLAQAGLEEIAFVAETSAEGRAVLRLMDPNSAVSPGIGSVHPGSLILVEGALPEPWRRRPDPSPGAAPDASADPVRLERVLRERLPGAEGAGEEELAAAEERLGLELPAELKALYRVVSGRWTGPEGDHEEMYRQEMAVGCELFPPDRIHRADPSTRPAPWEHGAMVAVGTAADDAVQDLVGSPGWLVFGDTGGGDRIAVDLTPGPRGHLGQIIVIGHEFHHGAGLVAPSLTAMVCEEPSRGGGAGTPGPSAVAYVNHRGVQSIEEAAHPGLEVLSIGVWGGEPFRLGPVLGLPRLRTLSAFPGTLADPLEIGQLAHLEFLELSPEDWRILLDAKAVPPSLKACSVATRMHHRPLEIAELSSEILALWGRDPITWTVLEGDLVR